MYCCKDFYSLSVLSLYEGELIGKVNKLYFDKKLKRLMEIEILIEDGARVFLPTKNIYNVGKNAITIKNNQALVLKEIGSDYVAEPLNCKAYSINGEFLGVVDELSLNEKFVTQKISLDNSKTLDVKNMASCGKNTIIFYNGAEKVNVKNFTPNEKPIRYKSKVNQPATILPAEEGVTSNVNINTLVQNEDFLIGRTCLKDIFNFNNEILIKAHGIVNKKNLKEVKKFGKLRELMIYLK